MNGTFAFVNYIRFRTLAGAWQAFNYQNFSVGQTRSYGGVTYAFAPFAMSGGAGSRGGDRASSNLVAGTDAISVNVVAQAVDENWLIEVKTVQIDPGSFADIALIRSELWRMASYELDHEKIAATLTPPLDAVQDQAPSRYLSTYLVGALPSSGTLVLR